MAKTTNSSKNDLFGGLKIRNIDKIDNKFICAICKLLLFYPCQLLCCGILLCKWCLQNGLSDSEPFICSFCHTEQPKKEALRDRGAERELKKITIVCFSCSWDGSYIDYLDHLQEFHADLECIDCHERFFAINSYQEHRQELCIHRCLSCGLPNCLNSIKWFDMQAHYLNSQHQFILYTIVCEHIHPKQQQLQNQKHNEIMKKEHKDIQESTAICLATYEILSNDPIRIKVELSQIQINLDQNISKINELKKYDTEIEKKVEELVANLNTIQIELDDIKKTREENNFLILDNDSTTTIPFNCPNVSPFSINSLKFKTSEHGCTFMLRVCSTDEAKEEYLSLFLSLFDGPYNNLIPFPFSYDIHFVLWDQSNQQKHIKYVLKPDLNSSAFNRPTSEKNEEYGIIQFCSLRYLTDPKSIYVKDGMFFIRVFIDFLNTGLNPFQLKDNIPDTETMLTTTMTTD